MSLPTPYYSDDAVTIYHGDCRDILPLLEPVDLVLTDPPYGMKWNGKITRGKNGTGSAEKSRHYGTTIIEDDTPFDPSFLLSYETVILFGANHFPQHLFRGTFLIWVKRYPDGYGSFLSDAETAWMNKGHGCYCFTDLSNQGDSKNKAHPTQKPKPLMQWCIEKSKTAGVVLDPFMGSGTTLRAAKDLGRKAIGIELEEKYCEIAARRMSQEVLAL